MSAHTLRAALAAQGGTVAAALTDDPFAGDDPSASDGDHASVGAVPRLAASGPRAAGREAEYELLLEMILEGSRLHYGGPRVVNAADPDLALLLGDQLYALGLSRLAALGDLEAVTELGDLISLVAQAQLHEDQDLARAVWRAGAAAIGWGGSEMLEEAKQRARAGDPAGASALDRAREAIVSGGCGTGA